MWSLGLVIISCSNVLFLYYVVVKRISLEQRSKNTHPLDSALSHAHNAQRKPCQMYCVTQPQPVRHFVPVCASDKTWCSRCSSALPRVFSLNLHYRLVVLLMGGLLA